MDKCKVCGVFSTLSKSIAEELNQYILDRSVTAEFAARELGVGASTVKKHRAEKHAF